MWSEVDGEKEHRKDLNRKSGFKKHVPQLDKTNGYSGVDEFSEGTKSILLEAQLDENNRRHR